MLRNKSRRTILLLNKSDFISQHNDMLLAHLEDVQEINFGSTLNFSTQTYFAGDQEIPVIRAFNNYLRGLSRDVERIIINLDE